MADDWIKMRSSLTNHPKVGAIVSRLSATDARPLCARARKSAVLGAIFAFWSAADQHSEDGSIPGFSPEWFDEEVGLPGFCDALRAVGWLAEADGGSFQVPRFEEHMSESAKARAQNTKRKQRSRSGGSRAVVALPRDRCATRREENREEKKKEESPPTPPSDPAPVSPPVVPPVVEAEAADRIEAQPSDWERLNALVAEVEREWPKRHKAAFGRRALQRVMADALTLGRDDWALPGERALVYAASPLGRGEWGQQLANWVDHQGWLEDPASWRDAGKRTNTKPSPKPHADRVAEILALSGGDGGGGETEGEQ